MFLDFPISAILDFSFVAASRKVLGWYDLLTSSYQDDHNRTGRVLRWVLFGCDDIWNVKVVFKVSGS